MVIYMYSIVAVPSRYPRTPGGKLPDVRERHRDNGLAHRYDDGVSYGPVWLTARIRPWVPAVLEASEYGAIQKKMS